MPLKLGEMRDILEHNVQALEAVVGSDITLDDVSEMLRQSDKLVMTLVERVAEFVQAIYHV